MGPVFPLSPDFQIWLGAEEIEAALGESIESVEVHQALNSPSRLILSVRDPEGRWQKEVLGAEKGGGHPRDVRERSGEGFSIALASNGGEKLFSGAIEWLNARMTSLQALRLELVAGDELSRLARSYRHQLHPEARDLDLVRSLARQLGLSISASCPPIAIPKLMQDGSSDLAFLQSLGRLVGREFFCWKGEMLWLDLSGRLAGESRVKLPRSLEKESVFLRWGEDLERVSVRLKRESLPRRVWVPGSQPETGDVFRRASSPASFGSDGGVEANSWLQSEAPHELAEASPLGFGKAAEVEWERLRRRSQVLSAVVRNLPGLRPGQAIEIESPEALAQGSWIVERLKHRWGRLEGLVSSVEAFRALG